MSALVRKLLKYRDQERMNSMEGERGFRNLCQIVSAIGYKDPMYRMQIDRKATVGDLMDFFADNPGAIEAVIDWIGAQRNTEWEENLEMQLIDEDGGDDEEDDVNDDNED
jgi:hypothetical protein